MNTAPPDIAVQMTAPNSTQSNTELISYLEKEVSLLGLLKSEVEQKIFLSNYRTSVVDMSSALIDFTRGVVLESGDYISSRLICIIPFTLILFWAAFISTGILPSKGLERTHPVYFIAGSVNQGAAAAATFITSYEGSQRSLIASLLLSYLIWIGCDVAFTNAWMGTVLFRVGMEPELVQPESLVDSEVWWIIDAETPPVLMTHRTHLVVFSENTKAAIAYRRGVKKRVHLHCRAFNYPYQFWVLHAMVKAISPVAKGSFEVYSASKRIEEAPLTEKLEVNHGQQLVTYKLLSHDLHYTTQIRDFDDKHLPEDAWEQLMFQAAKYIQKCAHFPTIDTLIALGGGDTYSDVVYRTSPNILDEKGQPVGIQSVEFELAPHYDHLLYEVRIAEWAMSFLNLPSSNSKIELFGDHMIKKVVMGFSTESDDIAKQILGELEHLPETTFRDPKTNPCVLVLNVNGAKGDMIAASRTHLRIFDVKTCVNAAPKSLWLEKNAKYWEHTQHLCQLIWQDPQRKVLRLKSMDPLHPILLIQPLKMSYADVEKSLNRSGLVCIYFLIANVSDKLGENGCHCSTDAAAMDRLGNSYSALTSSPTVDSSNAPLKKEVLEKEALQKAPGKKVLEKKA